MTRILGTLLGVSFQTELLIMTLLGLANSTLDWKPFELVLRLNLIRDLHFSSVENVQLSTKFTKWIKRLLSATVVVEFFFSLINPFAYLLKLYPVITWSHSDFLLPWLITHALNTILPKMLSVALAFVFYSENIISTMSLMEFLIVESINLLVAWYNWYVFFAFYLDLREVDRKRSLRRSQEKMIVSADDSYTYLSIPNIHEIFRKSSPNSREIKEMRIVRSLTILTENDSQEVDLDENSTPTLSIEDNLSPAERTMKMLNLTEEDLEDARKHKYYFEAPILRNPAANLIITKDIDYQDEKYFIVQKSDSSINIIGKACSCTSSEDEDEVMILVSKKIQTESPTNSQEISLHISESNIEIQSKIRSNNKLKQTMNQSTQVVGNFDKSSNEALTFCPSTSTIVNHPSCDLNASNNNIHLLLNKNFEYLDQMCRTQDFKNQNIPKNNMHKWLIFRHELESNLDNNLFLKESHSRSNIRQSTNIECKNLKDSDTQTENKIKAKKKNKQKYKTLLNITKAELVQDNLNCVQNVKRSSAEKIKKYLPVQQTMNKQNISNDEIKTKGITKDKIFQLLDFNAVSNTIPSTCLSEKKPNRSHRTFARTSFYNPLLDNSKYRKSKISVFKSVRPLKWSESIQNRRSRELRNLQAYNSLTLVQDRQEMLQKKKKLKMTSYKNAVADLILHNSTYTPTNAEINLTERLRKSNQSREKVYTSSIYQTETKETKDSILKRFMKYSEFLNKNIFSDTPVLTKNMSENILGLDDEELDQFIVEEELQNFDSVTDNDINPSSISKAIDIPNFEIEFKPVDTVSRTSQEEIIIGMEDISTASEIRRLNMRETIERIDWNNASFTTNYSPTTTNSKNNIPSRIEEGAERCVIVDDETLSMLQNAFSFSDESDRGFRLGPESNEPYPVFQIVALTMAEIFKATDWRNFSDILPTQPENEIEISVDDSTIFCGTEVGCIDNRNSNNSTDLDIFAEMPRNFNPYKYDEIEEKKTISSCLLEQLQELLDLSHETLSAIENSHIINGDACKLKSIDDSDNLFCNNIIEYITTFKDLHNRGQKIKNDIKTLEMFVCTVDRKESISQDDSNSDEINQNVDQQHTLNSTLIPQVELSQTNEENSDSKRESNKSKDVAQTPQIRNSKVCETVFENKIQVHQLKGKEGLSSGNVMEFDSDVCVLRSLKSQNPSISVKSTRHESEQSSTCENDSENMIKNSNNRKTEEEQATSSKKNVENSSSKVNVVTLFNSFYQKILKQIEEDPENIELQENLKILAKTPNFSNFMSLLNSDNLEATKSVTSINSKDDNLSNILTYNKKVPSIFDAKMELNSSFFHKDDNNEFKNEGNVILKNANTEYFEKKDLTSSSMVINVDNISSISEINIVTSYSQELLNKHHQQLNTDINAQTIANWNTDSEESVDAIGLENALKMPEETRSFSNNSEMEEFPMI